MVAFVPIIFSCIICSARDEPVGRREKWGYRVTDIQVSELIICFPWAGGDAYVRTAKWDCARVTEVKVECPSGKQSLRELPAGSGGALLIASAAINRANSVDYSTRRWTASTASASTASLHRMFPARLFTI